MMQGFGYTTLRIPPNNSHLKSMVEYWYRTEGVTPARVKPGRDMLPQNNELSITFLMLNRSTFFHYFVDHRQWIWFYSKIQNVNLPVIILGTRQSWTTPIVLRNIRHSKIDILRRGRNGLRFADSILKISKCSMNIVAKNPISNKSVLVQAMAWGNVIFWNNDSLV